jgi:hypothetical protein
MERYAGNQILGAPEGYYWHPWDGEVELVELKHRERFRDTNVRRFGETHGRWAYGFSQEFVLVGPILPPDEARS